MSSGSTPARARTSIAIWPARSRPATQWKTTPPGSAFAIAATTRALRSGNRSRCGRYGSGVPNCGPLAQTRQNPRSCDASSGWRGRPPLRRSLFSHAIWIVPKVSAAAMGARPEEGGRAVRCAARRWLRWARRRRFRYPSRRVFQYRSQRVFQYPSRRWTRWARPRGRRGRPPPRAGTRARGRRRRGRRTRRRRAGGARPPRRCGGSAARPRDGWGRAVCPEGARHGVTREARNVPSSCSNRADSPRWRSSRRLPPRGPRRR
jgi:hypothetical protein